MSQPTVRSLAPEKMDITPLETSSVQLSRHCGSLTVFSFLVLSLAGCKSRDTDVAIRLRGLENKLNIKVEAPTNAFSLAGDSGTIIGEPATFQELESFSSILEFELGLYPSAFVSRAGLKRIVLCRNLVGEGKERAGICRQSVGTVYLDVGSNRLVDRVGREVIHHEIYHLVDHAEDGVIGFDTRWEALNTRGLRKIEPNSRSSLHSDRPFGTSQTGFINSYSRTAIPEDKAEIFALMMADDVVASYWSKRDDVVRAKIERIAETIGRFCPECNSDFWTRVRQQRRNQAAYREYEIEVTKPHSVVLVPTTTPLEIIMRRPQSTDEWDMAKKLDVSLILPDMNLLHMHSLASGSPPVYTLESVPGKQVSYALIIHNVMISDEQVAPELLNAIAVHRKVELPMRLEIAFCPEGSTGSMSFAIRVIETNN